MIKETNFKQIPVEEFKTPFEKGLDPKNRWVILAHVIPWEKLAEIYTKNFHKDFGRPATKTQIIIGAIIIKHFLKSSDEDTIELIRENPYLQYFLGLSGFSHKPVFHPTLFVKIRKRLGPEAFEKMSGEFFTAVNALKAKQSKGKKKAATAGENKDGEEKQHQGQLILDATVAPADFKYPTDLDLLNTSREQSEKLIDHLCKNLDGIEKPRTYRRVARKEYLILIKQKKKDHKKIRKAIRKQLNYLRRNIKSINTLLDLCKARDQLVDYQNLHIFWIIQEVYRQQKQMYDQISHQTDDRIVSVSQPHVRPIVRGKSGKEVEFGAKISASLVDGYIYLDKMSWDAFNENKDLKKQVENFKERFGFYPEVVIADKIYGSRENRDYLKEHGIRFSGKALGRPPALTEENAEELKKRRKKFRNEQAKRNGIEGKFGEGKRKYNLERIKAKTAMTSESWIATIFLVMNLARWLREYFFVFFQDGLQVDKWVSFLFLVSLNMGTNYN